MIRGQQWFLVEVSPVKKVSTFLTVLAIASTSAFAQTIHFSDEPANDKIYGWDRPQFSAYFEGASFSEGKNEQNLLRGDLNIDTRYEMSSWAHFKLNPRLTLSNGRVQQRFDVDSSQSSKVSLGDTHLSLHTQISEWFEKLELRLGAHWQSYLGSSLLVSRRRSFVGAQEHMIFKLGSEVKLKFISQQAVPDSSSDNSIREDREKTPIFTAETISLEWKRPHVFEIEPFITHYQFQNLPAVVAADSATIGNTVTGEVGPDSRFRYAFNGVMAGTRICACNFETVKLVLYTYGIQNTAAPKGARRAQWVGLKTPIAVTDAVDVVPSYAQYFIESDVVPAAYNSGSMGHNNRNGQRIGLDIDFKKLGFSVETDYIQANTITATPEQSKLNALYIGLSIGTQYDVL